MLYKSIYECPIRVYQRIFEFDNVNLLIRSKWKFKLLRLVKKINLVEILDNIVIQLITEFGVSRKYEVKFYKERDLLRLKLDYLLGDISREVEIEIKERDLKKLEAKVPTIHDLRKENASMHRILSQWAGADSRTLTIFEYYNLIKDYEQYIENEQKAEFSRKNKNPSMRKVS